MYRGSRKVLMGLELVLLSAALAYVQECCYFSTSKIVMCDISLALEKNPLVILIFSLKPDSLSSIFFFTCHFFTLNKNRVAFLIIT